MKTILPRLVIMAATLFTVLPAQGGSWVFGRSYYSHNPVTPVQVGRQSAGGPYFTRPRGAYVRNGYRHLHSHIQIRGQTFDHTHLHESWVQFGEQF